MLFMMIMGLVFLPLSFATSVLERRGGQSNVICSSDFAWAEDDFNLNPCIVAASVQGACISTDMRVDKLENNTHYDVLKNPTACSCSWAAYNLLSACTACQGQQKSIQPWGATSASNECKPYISSDTFFPSNAVLESGRSIPYWATFDPKTWRDGSFNVDQARGLASEGHPDVNPAAPRPKKESPVAAIAGGVAGGVVIILLGIIGAWLIYRKKRRMAGIQEISREKSFRSRSIFHSRSISDMSQKTETTYGVPQQVGGFTVNVNAAPTIRTHASSVHSLPLTSSGISSPPTPSIFSLPQSPTRPHATLVPREEVIEPYTLHSPPSSPGRPPLHRKGTSDASDSSLPVSRAEEHSGNGNGRQRLNPPAYTGPSTTNPNGNAGANRNRSGHGMNPGSLDSQQSWETVESRNTHAIHGNMIATATSNNAKLRHHAPDDSPPIA